MSISTRRAAQLRAGILAARTHYESGDVVHAHNMPRPLLAAYAAELTRLNHITRRAAHNIATAYADTMTLHHLDLELDERTGL